MEPIKLAFTVDGEDFAVAGTASAEVKRALKKIGVPQDIIRKAAICMYEGEINMVIHANGGEAIVDITADEIIITLKDTGPGIPDVSQAMQEGFSTATENVRNLGFGAGMGLPNMKTYSDTMEVESEVGRGTTVKMTVKI